MGNDYLLGSDRIELERLTFQDQVFEKQTQHLLRHFSNGQHLLDLGAGPGLTTQALAKVLGPQGKVLGVDSSDRFAKHYQEALDVAPQVDFLHGDVQKVTLRAHL